MAITIESLDKVIAAELGRYSGEIVKAVNAETKKAADELKKKTKQTAPKDTGEYAKHIATRKAQTDERGSETYEWYVKPPEHGLTRLLNDGHMTRNGGFVKGTGFLDKAVDEVQQEYEQAVAEAIERVT